MHKRIILGIVFIVAALLNLADMWNIIKFDGLIFGQPWTAYIAPVLLLDVGVEAILYSFRHNSDQWLKRPLPLSEEGKRISCSVHYGGDEYTYHGEPFHGAQLDAFCGGIRLDLREAVISEDEEIDINTFMGGVELFVPTTVNVVVKSRNFLGGVSNKTNKSMKSGSPCLYIVASNFFGGVSITHHED